MVLTLYSSTASITKDCNLLEEAKKTLIIAIRFRPRCAWNKADINKFEYQSKDIGSQLGILATS